MSKKQDRCTKFQLIFGTSVVYSPRLGRDTGFSWEKVYRDILFYYLCGRFLKNFVV